jgi:hypothetical protein
MADEKKKFILVVGISGTVTVEVEAKDDLCHRGQDAHTSWEKRSRLKSRCKSGETSRGA